MSCTSHAALDSNVQTRFNKPLLDQSEAHSRSQSSNANVRSASTSITVISKSPTALHNCTVSSFHGTDGPTSSEADAWLVEFQTRQSKYFPFIHIPPTTDAHQLRQQRPFLWLAIMTASSKSISLQKVLGDRLRQTVAWEMVVQSKKSIDLLLGLLVFIGWWGACLYQDRKLSFDSEPSGLINKSIVNLFWLLSLN